MKFILVLLFLRHFQKENKRKGNKNFKTHNLVRFFSWLNCNNCHSVSGGGQGAQGGNFFSITEITFLKNVFVGTVLGNTCLYLFCLRWIWWTNATWSVPWVSPHVPQRWDPYLYSAHAAFTVFCYSFSLDILGKCLYLYPCTNLCTDEKNPNLCFI